MSGGRKCRATHARQNIIKINIDFHIFDIINFDLLIGCPLGELHPDSASLGSLYERLREAASATTTSLLENPMSKPLLVPNPNPLEEVMHVSLFVSSELVLYEMAKPYTLEGYDSEEILHHYEGERLSSPLTECEPLPTGLYHIGFN